MKKCTKCGLEKEENQFYKNTLQCKSCKKEYRKEYYENNKEKLLEQKRGYYENNKEEIKEYHKEYYENNKENILENKKEYYENNKEEIKIYKREYYANNKEKNKEYRENNKEEIKEKEQAYKKEKRKKDPAFKLRLYISHSICRALKNQGSSKRGQSILKYLPYNIQQLKDHIEKQFKETGNEWMNWNNHGAYVEKNWDDDDQSTWTWHLDHRIAQSKLPFSSMEDENFQKCWALNNLRPYSAKQNVIDSDRR